MRFLNKVVFINSAGIKYAEVNLDGNVHFIGTQGVGKTTLLRALLFFYNVDKLKIGITKEKKPFDEYYFPFQNSYLVFEIQTENGHYCVLVFKSQGRAAFRFFNSAFDKSFFIDKEGKVYDTQDKIREVFGRRDIYYTKIIQNYEGCRDIIYGNNKELPNEFRKYALFESKQYHNIPRTITNVFLNTDLSAEFVKETIIKSLNEEEIKIVLNTYSQSHLKGFESGLNDLKKWTDKEKNGECLVETQAKNVINIYLDFKNLDKKITEVYIQLCWALDKVNKEQPLFTKKLETEQLNKTKVEENLNNIKNTFEKNKGMITEQIIVHKHKLNDVERERKHYEKLKIETILERASKKKSLELEKENISSEKKILTSKFFDIESKYTALLKDMLNQQKEFENSKQAEKNTFKENFLQFKEKINDDYESLFEDIRKQYLDDIIRKKELLREKTSVITDILIKISEVKNKKFYEDEIKNRDIEIVSLNAAISKAENEIIQANGKIENLHKEEEFESSRLKQEINRKIEKQTDTQKIYFEKINAIDKKLNDSKDSLYGWLNEQIPNWDENIGKIIDEENVLFKKDLNPEKVLEESEGSFYCIKIDTNKIVKNVKKVEDYEKEKEDIKKDSQLVQYILADLNSQLKEGLEKINQKFQSKIKELKEKRQSNEDIISKNKLRLNILNGEIIELKDNAEAEKKATLDKLEKERTLLQREEIKLKEEIQAIETNINKQIDSKKREKESGLKSEQQKLEEKLKSIDKEIHSKKIEITEKEKEIKEEQKREFENKGVDTHQLEKIDGKIKQICLELNFIDENISVVEQYKYIKENLLDKESYFRKEKSALENQLETDAAEYNQQRDKLLLEEKQIDAEIRATSQKLEEFKDDLMDFESFKKTESYQTIRNSVDFSKSSEVHKTDARGTKIIWELNNTYNLQKDKFTNLQNAVNKFTGSFEENNLFSFKTKFTEKSEYIDFAESLKEFIEENKIEQYNKRVEERIALIIRQIGKETDELISKEGEIQTVINDINRDFVARKFVQAIKSMSLRITPSANKIFQLLREIKKFNDENGFVLGDSNLFAQKEQPAKKEEAISLLKQLIKEIPLSNKTEITLPDSFDLQFRIEENDNDSGWVEKLKNVGSDGTDILVKAMINIMLLNVFKERAAKKHKDDFRLHCMMDEIGKLHPTNVKGILNFANDRNILLINSSPTSYNAADYKYTYLVVKDSNNVTSVKRLVRKISNPETQQLPQTQ